MPYDLFVSYARKDNENGFVTAFADELVRAHKAFSKRELSVFFDKSEIRSMDDWHLRLFGSLRDSSLMLAFLSPNYVASPWCCREWEMFRDLELNRFMLGEGIAPVYIVEVPGYQSSAPDLSALLRDLGARQATDVREWFPHGEQAIRERDVQQRLAGLLPGIEERLTRRERAGRSVSTLPIHNVRFVGRREELVALRHALTGDGRICVVAAVHGIGGIGKTELALAYAHAFAHEYPGGRFLIRCEGRTDFREALVADLPGALGIEFPENEKTVEQRYARVRRALEERETSLLVLDNVDKQEILAPNQLSDAPDSRKVHLVATTRLDVKASPECTLVDLDVLTTEDGVRLIEAWRGVLSDAERAPAEAIVQRLGGHALAIEVAGVYLSNHPSTSLPDYLRWLEEAGIGALDKDAPKESYRKTASDLQKLLEPTFEMLSPAAMLALEYASVCPPDSVPLPWLRDLVGADMPEAVAVSTEPPSDPWEDNIVPSLTGMRLLTEPSHSRGQDVPPVGPGHGQDAHDTDTAVVRMHRLVQEVVRKRMGEAPAAEQRGKLVEHAKRRCEIRQGGWVKWENRWEIPPLTALADERMEAEDADGAWLANGTALMEQGLGNLPEAKRLLTRAIEIDEKAYKPDHPALARDYSNLATVEKNLGNLPEAKRLLTRAIEIWEKAYEPDHPTLATSYSNLALVEQDLGNLPEAKRLLTRAIEIDEKAYEPDHPTLAVSYWNLATVVLREGSREVAVGLLRRAHAIFLKRLGPDHPQTRGVVSWLRSVGEEP